ncbi:MAG: hypothetical protein HFJ45_05530 [Clostridia bacterium]|nr:hypothetical protein [Clostridia bacterium]
MNKKLNLKNKIFIIIILSTALICVSFISPNECFASDPVLINKLRSAFEKIESYIIKVATPVAAVAVCSGALMKKFSFGDEEKIRTGRNLIKGSIFSYGLVLCTDMILSLIKTLVG